jgi:hypothetical protein
MSERCRKSVRAPLIDRRWWLHIPSDDTKSHRVDERQVPEFITDVVSRYLTTHRPFLCRGVAEQLALWVSSTTGRQLTVKNLGTLISKITREAIGVDVLRIYSELPAHQQPPSTAAIIHTSPARSSLTATRASPKNTTIAR